MATGCRALASASSRMTTANSADESRAHPAPEVATGTVRRGGTLRHRDRRRRNVDRPVLFRVRTEDLLGRRLLHRGEQAAGDGQRQADHRRRRERFAADDGDNRDDAAGQRRQWCHDREVAGDEAAEEHAKGRGLAQTAAHSEGYGPPLGGAGGRAVQHQGERQHDDEPHGHGPGHRRPDGGRAHHLDHEEVVERVAERRAEAEDDGEHGRTLLDAPPPEGAGLRRSVRADGAPGRQAPAPRQRVSVSSHVGAADREVGEVARREPLVLLGDGVGERIQPRVVRLARHALGEHRLEELDLELVPSGR